MMNPRLIFTVAKVAYKNREIASKLLSKIKDLKKSDNRVSEKEISSMSSKERLERLEIRAEAKDTLREEQSELIADLATNMAELSATTESLLARLKLLTWMVITSFCLSIIALVLATN